MRPKGLLEAMARVDLDELIEEIGLHYRSGSLEALRAADPEWGAALDRAESEAGALYAALRDADRTLGRWRRSVAELRELWARVREVPGEDETERGDRPDLELEVA